MKVSNSAANSHLDDSVFYYSTSLTSDTNSSLPSPPSSFYDKNSHETTAAFCDGPNYDNTTTTAAERNFQPQNYTIDHSFHTLSPTAPALSSSYDSNSDNENMTIRHSPDEHYQQLLPITSPILGSQKRYHQAPSNKFEPNDTKLASETDHRSCHECGKIYKHPSCLYKHLWEHSEGWELTSKLPLTKHQQVQILEAATILIGMSAKTDSLSSASSSLVEFQSVYPYGDSSVDVDNDGAIADDSSDIISIVDDDDDPSSF